MFPRRKIGKVFYANCWFVSIYLFLFRNLRCIILKSRPGLPPHSMNLSRNKFVVHFKATKRGKASPLYPWWIEGTIEVFSPTLIPIQKNTIWGRHFYNEN